MLWIVIILLIPGHISVRREKDDKGETLGLMVGFTPLSLLLLVKLMGGLLGNKNKALPQNNALSMPF